MAEFKLVISDPKAKKAYQTEIKSPDADRLFGKKVGEAIKGESINLAGFEFKITGGSDKQGFPMRPDVLGTRRIKALIGGGPGIKVKRKGERKRRSVRGNQIADDISQINLKVIKEGSKPIGIVLGKDTEEKPVEAETKEAPIEEKKDDAKNVKEEPKAEEKKEETKPAEPKSKETEEATESAKKEEGTAPAE